MSVITIAQKPGASPKNPITDSGDHSSGGEIREILLSFYAKNRTIINTLSFIAGTAFVAGTLWSRRSPSGVTGSTDTLAALLERCGIKTKTIKAGVNTGEETAIIMGDMTTIKADAYVVPHFKGGASNGGVGAAIYRSGAVQGMRDYARIADINRNRGIDVPWGTCTLTQSGGGQSKYLLNVVSVGNPGTPQDEAFTILKSVLSALQTASEHRIDSVVIPALGTGIIGKLTPAQSAWTILHAVEQFRLAKPNTIPQKIIIAIYGDPQTYEVFSRILTLGTQDPTAMSMARGPGRTFDLIRWLAEAEAGDRVKLS